MPHVHRVIAIGTPAVLITASMAAAGGRPQDVPGFEDLHWAVRLGLRAEQVDRTIPIVNQVVLVPNGATYLDEVGRWSPAGRWPVLWDDDPATPMFIRRFRPDRIVRRASVGRLPVETHDRRARMEAVVVRAWGGDPLVQRPAEVFAARDHAPTGVVLADDGDPAWPAAVALAAGHGQVLRWLDGEHGRPNQELGAGPAELLRATVQAAVEATGLVWEGLGDTIDAVTVCRVMGGRARPDLPRSLRPQVPAEADEGPVATTDWLGRRADGTRWAFVGWIFGHESRCAYMAMCSLFLDRSSWWLCNTYPEDGAWLRFGMDDVARRLQARGHDVTHLHGREAALPAFRRAVAGGIEADVLLLTSRGSPDFFETFDGRATAHDVPVLTAPAALYMCHSWSLKTPSTRRTVGGRWLERGVYAYFGSVHEPFLGAFVPPEEVSRRCDSMVPFLVATRWWPGEGPLSMPWRLNAIGDPLMRCGPPTMMPRPRLDPPGEGDDLRVEVAQWMRRASEDGDDEAFAAAIHGVILLGEDGIARELWRLAEAGRGDGPRAAEAVLGALFRLEDVEAFLRAWEKLPQPTEPQLDLLWHLVGARLGSSTDEATLLLLESAIRRPLAHGDIERLASLLARALGTPHVRSLIEREIEREPVERWRKELEKLLRRY